MKKCQKTFTRNICKKVAEKLAILKMIQEERANYTYYQKKLYDDRNEMKAAENRGLEKGREEGLEKGREEGKIERNIEIAKNLLKLNFDIESISKATGLIKEEIQKLES